MGNGSSKDNAARYLVSSDPPAVQRLLENSGIPAVESNVDTLSHSCKFAVLTRVALRHPDNPDNPGGLQPLRASDRDRSERVVLLPLGLLAPDLLAGRAEAPVFRSFYSCFDGFLTVWVVSKGF